MQEDKYQLHRTLKVFLRFQKLKDSSKYSEYILKLLSDPSLSITQISAILLSDIDLWTYLIPLIDNKRTYFEFLSIFSSYKLESMFYHRRPKIRQTYI